MPYRRYVKAGKYAYRGAKFALRHAKGFARGGMLVLKALRQIRYLKTLVNAEVHKLDTSITTDPTSSGYLTHLTAVPQGDGVAARTGNSIFLKYVSIKGTLECDSSATASCVRAMLIMDKQQIADTAPAVTDVLNSADVDAFLNTNNVGRFSILMDRKFILTTSGQNRKRYINMSRTYRHHVRYNGAAGTDQQRGALYLLLLSDEATNTPQVNLTSRIGFYDN